MKHYVNYAHHIKKENGLKVLPYKKEIYGLFSDKGFTPLENKYPRLNFIDYVKRSQEQFDMICPDTNNLMIDQIKNRQKKLDKLLGYKLDY